MGNVKVPERLRTLFDEAALGHVSYLNPREIFTIEIDRVSPSDRQLARFRRD
jgi:hypothetical protein